MKGAAEAAVAWLLDDGARLPFLEDVFAGVCTALRAAGLPLDRATLHLRALHPQFRAVRLRWHQGEARAELLRVGDATLQSAAFRNSPVRALFEGAEGLRQRLDVPLPAAAFAIYGELQAEGYTDYVALPLVFTNNQRIASSWATRRPGGWRTDDLMELDALRQVLAMAAEIRIVRRLGRNIAETYLGRRAGARVLDGQIVRGDLVTIDAVIACLDLRDFTRFSEATGADAVVARLNVFYDAFGAAMEAEDGEILKFMGDGLLAIFPLDEGGTAAARAVTAALAGEAALARANADLDAGGADPIRFGLALHRGRVGYGNIGTEARLDFTVLGPAVNVASRLEELTKRLGETIIVSAAVAGSSDRPFRPLGPHAVRGVSGDMELFAPERPVPS